MKKSLQTSVAVGLMLSTALSSFAAETPRALVPASPTTIVSRGTALDPAELARYQVLDAQAQPLASHQAAGADNSTKTVLTVVGVVVITAGLIVVIKTAMEGAAASSIMAGGG